MNEGTQPERIQYLDILRVLSILAVVFLHTVAGNLRENFGSVVWHFSNVLTSLMSASVPLFFMISGAVLLSSPKTLSVAYTLRNRLPKVLIPFLVWSLVAVAYYAIISWRVDGTPDLASALAKLKNLPAQPTALHLWFMYALIPLYILSPIIKGLTDSLERQPAIYLLVIWVFFSSLLPTLAAFTPEAYRPIFVLDSLYNLAFMAGFAGYFIIGYYLMQLSTPIKTSLVATIIVADTIIIALGTWWKTGSTGIYSEMFKTYTRMFVLILAIAIFLLFKGLLQERRLRGVIVSAVRFMVPLSFGIYLIHNFVIDMVSRTVPWWPAKSVPAISIAYIGVLAISIFCIFAVSAIKPFCFVFTGQRYKSKRKQ